MVDLAHSRYFLFEFLSQIRSLAIAFCGHRIGEPREPRCRAFVDCASPQTRRARNCLRALLRSFDFHLPDTFGFKHALHGAQHWIESVVKRLISHPQYAIRLQCPNRISPRETANCHHN
jgi:hypothetical protein